MSGRSRSAQPRDFQFVNFSSPTDMHDAASKSRIRKHAMKVSGLARRRSKQQQGDLIEVQLQIWPGNESTLEQHEDTNADDELIESDPVMTADNETQTSEEAASMIRQKTLATLNEPSSVFGMQPSETSDIEPHWVFDYPLHVTTSICLVGDTGSMIQPPWPASFLQDPLIFHATHWCASVLCNLLTKTPQWTISQEALMHKAEAMRLVRQRLERLDENKVEWLIYAILCLARSEGSMRANASSSRLLPFVPHLPCANWTNLYGKTDLLDEHRHALSHLVSLQGGLHQLQMPGLSLGLALTDLQAASTSYHTPMFPKFWDIELTDLHPSWTLPILITSPVGQGFFVQKGVSLTEEAVRVFTELSAVDRILSHRGLHWAKGVEATPLLRARNSAHYDLLCLPAWHSLDSMSKSQSHYIGYELCRLTCVLYSNAVLMGLPPDNGWYGRMIERLIRLLELCNVNQAKNLSKLFTWSLFTACLAAYEFPEREFFEQRLREVLSRSQIREWDVLHGILQDFLWSDAACEMRAKDLWQNLDLKC